MRTRLLSATAIAAVGAIMVVSVAPAESFPKAGSNTFACKVLKKAIAGTPLGQHATHIQVNGSGPGGCRYDTGEAGGLWVADVGIKTYGSALARRFVREECKPMLTASNYVGDWLTTAESGADVACRIGVLDKSLKTTTNNSVFAKGRWYGHLSTITPSRFAPNFESLLRKVTAQLPR